MTLMRRSSGYPWPTSSLSVLSELLFALRRRSVHNTKNVQAFIKQNNKSIADRFDRHSDRSSIGSPSNHPAGTRKNPPHHLAFNSYSINSGTHSAATSPLNCNPDQTPAPAKVKVKGVRIYMSKKENERKEIVK